MKFALAKEHHDFFDKNGYIEFDGLIAPPTAEKLSKAIKQQVGNRVNQLPERLSMVEPMKLFMKGRDLWRTHPDMKKQAASLNLAAIASQLVRQKPIRLTLDQWIPAGLELKDIASLEQLVPVQGILAGAFIALDASVSPEESSFFPKEAGSILFVKPDTVIPFGELTKARSQNFLLILYSSRNSVYIYKETDPLTHYLKELGYVYGDRFSDQFHPLLLQ